MAKLDKYDTIKIFSKPVQQDNNGNYLVSPEAKQVIYRIGKHTKGKLTKPGQLFLTETNQMMVVVDTEELKFKDRHEFTPMQRFLNESISF